MKPGVELDVLVAEKVMGWEKNFNGQIDKERWAWSDTFWTNEYIDEPYTAFRPSIDIAAAWTVVEKLISLFEDEKNGKANNFLDFHLRYGDGPQCDKWVVITENYMLGLDKSAMADTAPHAICLAALKAKGVEL